MIDHYTMGLVINHQKKFKAFSLLHFRKMRLLIMIFIIIMILGKETFSWLKTVGNNIRGIVGLTVSQKWAPDVNKTNETEENGEEG